VPTYEYKCTVCGHRYETREGFDAPSTQACPNCGSLAKRVLFPPPIVFKGSGFYVTDSRNSKSGRVDSVTVPPAEKVDSDGAAPATKEESKPATTATSDASD
jgi:putative FmdB family regulatory protein